MNQCRQTGQDIRFGPPIYSLWGPFALMGVISIFSGSAGVQLEGWSFTGVDKLGHLLVFGLLGVAWFRCLETYSLRGARALAWAVALTTAFGLADEMHQYHNPLRYFEWADLGADFAGALLAGFLYWRWPLFHSVLEVKFSRVRVLRSSDKATNSPS